jgi:hypothetical protein
MGIDGENMTRLRAVKPYNIRILRVVWRQSPRMTLEALLWILSRLPLTLSFLHSSLYHCISHSLKFHLKKQTRRTLISSLFCSSTRKSRSINLYKSVEKNYWLDYGSKDRGIRFWFPVWAGNPSVPHSVKIYFRKVRRPERESDHSPSFNADIMNAAIWFSLMQTSSWHLH